MKILLLGKNGQVGSELSRTLLALGQVLALARQDLCLSNLKALEAYLLLHKPTIIVNAAAYTAVDQAETEQQLAHLINAESVAVLANYAKNNNALLIHYSTDYVFDGEKKQAYIESDAPNPLNKYGLTKRAGELAILNSGCKHLIFRTSWVYSATGNNFIKTILKLAKDKTSLKVIADQIGAPTSAELIADVTALAIASYQKGQLADGIYHLTASGSTSWHQLACYVVNKAADMGVSLNLNAKAIEAIATEGYPLPAARPKNSLLDHSALSKGLNLHIPEWNVYVDRVLEQLTRKCII